MGNEIVLSGNQFGSAPVVIFGSGTATLTAPVSSSDDNSIKSKVPYIAPGITQIRVQNDQGTTDPLPFIALQPGPIVTTVSPTNGLPGTTVTITGDFLNQLKLIRFADIDATIKDSTAQKLTVVVPPNVPRGPIFLSIETKGGLSTSNFIVAGVPQITSLAPLKTKPGAELVIKGTNLLNGDVRVNGKPTDKAKTTVTDTEIRTVIPTEATSGLVTVTVFEKLVATSNDSLQIFQLPVVARLSAQDAVIGDKILIEGRNLAAVTSVLFGGTAATSFRVISDTQLEAVVPTVTVSAPVIVSASSLGGTGSGVESLFVYLPPSAVTLNPDRQQRGRFVTVSGKNFYRVTDVQFNGISSPIISRVEGTSLVASVPDNGVSGPVTVISRAGTAAAPLVVIQKAIVTDVLPAKAQVSTIVSIKGDFLLNAQIFFAGTLQPAVDNGKATDTQRFVIVPKDAKTGPIRVINETNDATETATFTVLP
ncbi:hypothetical protein GCM10028773_02110 [Spirosoma koreense]